MKRYSVLASCAATTFLCGPVAVHADAAADVGSVDEVVVTARKVEERLLDVPLTITAFSSKDLEQAGATSIRDLAVATPGLFISSAQGSRSADRIALRGVTAVAGTAGFVGIYIDGVYVPSSLAQGLEVSNVERIEVLKGPQSALFGRATLSGAINYVTRRPGDEWQGQARASFGEFSQYDLSASASGPISDTFSLLVGARKYSRDSMFFNQLTQTEDVGGQSSQSATLGLRWQPTDSFDAYLRVLLSNDDDEAPGVYLQNSLFNNCLRQTPTGIPTYFCGEARPNPNAIRLVTRNSAVPAPFVGTFQDDGKSGLDRDSGRAALTLEWDLGNVLLTSITGYGRDKIRDATDLTTRAAFAYGPSVGLPSITFDRDVRFKDWSQELRATFPGEGRWSGLVGAYYYDESRTEALPYRTGPASFAGERSSTNYALFGRLQFDPTDRLSVAFEGRWQKDEIQLVNKFLTNNIDITVETDSFLPRFTADYKIAEELMVYAVASKGTKPASINTAPELANCPERQKTNEEEAKNYELGLKGRLFDRRVTFQAAVYKIDWSEQEYAGVLQPGECGGNTQLIRLTVNAGETEIKGMELEATAVVIPDWFDVRLAYSINDTQIKVGRATTATEALEGILAYGTAGFTPTCQAVAVGMGTQSIYCPAAPPGQVNTLQGGDFRGLNTSLPAQAEYLFSLTGNVGHALGDSGFDWFLRADYSRASKQFESIYNLAYVGPRQNLNLRLGIRSENFEAALWGRNVTNDDTPTAIIRSIAFADDDGTGPRTANSRAYSLYLADPRMYGLSLSYRF
jgi:outer membrane receptor protein involved in Fe transport